MLKTLSISVFIFLLTACSKEANHLPSIFELPGAIISTGIENTIYSHKRNKIKRYVVLHYDQLDREIAQGKGEALDRLLKRMEISRHDTFDIKRKLQKDHATMFRNSELATEAVIQSFSALYPPAKHSKTLNGMKYDQVYMIVSHYIQSHYPQFKKALQRQNPKALSTLADRLHLVDPSKRTRFYRLLLAREDALLIEPVVTGIMIHIR